MDLRERYRGALLGLAAGDALGTTVEFRPPGSFPPVADIVGGGPFGLKAGQWTDDTSMALCLAESLVERGGFDPVDQLERYVRWWRHGHLSCTGECFDIGATTAAALRRFEQMRVGYCGLTDARAAGNGSIMRLAPVPLAFARDARHAVLLSGDSSRTTHGAPECVSAARYLGGLIVGALHGASKEELLSPAYAPAPVLWQELPLAPGVEGIAQGSFLRREPPAIRGSGYVVATLEAALWAFARTETFAEGALRVVNLGDDADTTGAVYGQLAGAFYGEAGIAGEWRSRLCMRETIETLAGGLYSLAGW